MPNLTLVADIGGTNARFALAECNGKKIMLKESQRLRADDFETIHDATSAYLATVNVKPKHACFAVAGPVHREEISFTNSHWKFKPDEIKLSLTLSEFEIVNDFYALACGIEYLPENAFVKIKDGNPQPTAPILVIGPGTGLGQALIVPTNHGSKIIATEGGHTSFAPRTEEEMAVMKFIIREHPRVSVERLLSGRGLVNIHQALCAVNDTQPVPLHADEITQAAQNGDDPIAGKAVNMFCEILGQVAGDGVLGTGAQGGVVLGGGILPKIESLFIGSAFVECFLDKGRMRDYVDVAPIRMIISENGALYGAASIFYC